MMPSPPSAIRCPACDAMLLRHQYSSMNTFDATNWIDGYEECWSAPPFHLIRSCPACDAVYRYDSVQEDEEFQPSEDNPWVDEFPFERDPSRDDYFYALENDYAKTQAEEIILLTWIWWYANHRRRYDVQDLFEKRRSGPPKLPCDPMEVERYLINTEQYYQEVQLRVDFYLANPGTAKTAFVQIMMGGEEAAWEFVTILTLSRIIKIDQEEMRLTPPYDDIEAFDDLDEARKVGFFEMIAESELLSLKPEKPKCLSDLDIDFDYDSLAHLDGDRLTRRHRLTLAKKYWEQVRMLDQRVDEYHDSIQALGKKISAFAYEAREVACLRRLANSLRGEDNIQRAEILRELGEFDDAIAALDEVPTSGDDDPSISELLRELCHKRDSGLVCTWIPSMQFDNSE